MICPKCNLNFISRKAFEDHVKACDFVAKEEEQGDKPVEEWTKAELAAFVSFDGNIDKTRKEDLIKLAEEKIARDNQV